MDFVQIMKDWKRMCNAMGAEDEYSACERCELGDFGCPAIYENKCDGADWNRIENVVTQWAAKHPEPVFPTWKEWLFDIGIISNATICEIQNMKYIYADLCKPIPTDIAQKLGIEPKEG